MKKLLICLSICSMTTVIAGPSNSTSNPSSNPSSRHVPKIQYANISAPDALLSCPLEPAPELSTAISSLVSKIKDSVNQADQSQKNRCDSFQQRLNVARAELDEMAKNGIISQLPNSSSTQVDEQTHINFATRQATAINELVDAASEMMQNGCISSIQDRLVFQKMIGEILSVGGIFAGGWQGILTGEVGQIIGDLSLFDDKKELALDHFQQYDKGHSYRSFLCIYRQMLKTSCLMFPDETTQVVHGVNLNFESGPAQTTADSMNQLKQTSPEVVTDVSLLHEIKKNSNSLLMEMKKESETSRPSAKTVSDLRQWCSNHSSDQSFKSILSQNQHALESLEDLYSVCNQLSGIHDWDSDNSNLAPLISKASHDLTSLKGIYYLIRKDHQTDAGKAANTLETLQFFEKLKQTFSQDRSGTGSQDKLAYQSLTEEIGSLIAQNRFKSAMDEAVRILNEKDFFTGQSIHTKPIRKVALTAILDLCMTFDPTLVCLYPDSPLKNGLFREWKSKCVGTQSDLCSSASLSELNSLLDSSQYQSYLLSLCTKVNPMSEAEVRTRFHGHRFPPI